MVTFVIASLESQNIMKLLSKMPNVTNFDLTALDGLVRYGANKELILEERMLLCLILDWPYLPAKILRKNFPDTSILQLM